MRLSFKVRFTVFCTHKFVNNARDLVKIMQTHGLPLSKPNLKLRLFFQQIFLKKLRAVEFVKFVI